jgi:hypothetical protein
MSENSVATSDSQELHPFVKLAIAYVGIMAGFATIGLTFYIIATNGDSMPANQYYTDVASFAGLIFLSLAGLALLVERKRLGAYFVFAALVFSILAPSILVTGQATYDVVWWFVIPNAIVGILLMKSLKTLE